MGFLLSSIQTVVNFLFLAIVVGTLGISWIYARRLEKQYGAAFPWSKTGVILGVEVLIWIGFNVFWEFFKANWLIVSIIGAIVIAVVLSRKKRRHI